MDIVDHFEEKSDAFEAARLYPDLQSFEILDTLTRTIFNATPGKDQKREWGSVFSFIKERNKWL